MNTTIVLGVSVLAMVLLAPAVSADTTAEGDFTFETPARLDWSMDLTTSGADAADARTDLDADDDGTVTAQEVENFEDTMRGFIEDQDPELQGAVFVDDEDYSDYEFGDLDIRDAEGPASSTSPLTIHFSYVLTYPVTPSTEHVIRLESADEDPEAQEFSSLDVRVPTGYTVKSTSELPNGAYVSSDKRSVHFTGEEDTSIDSVEITIRKTNPGGSSSPPPSTRRSSSPTGNDVDDTGAGRGSLPLVGGGDDEGFLPGPGLFLTLITLAAVILFVRRPPRQRTA